jgi:hypothetical protein
MRYVAAVLEEGMSHDSESMTYSFFNIMTLHSSPKQKILEIERGSTRSHLVEISLWKRLRTCRKTDYRMNEFIPNDGERLLNKPSKKMTNYCLPMLLTERTDV